MNTDFFRDANVNPDGVWCAFCTEASRCSIHSDDQTGET